MDGLKEDGALPSPDQLSSLPMVVSVDDHVVETPTLWLDRLPRKLHPHVPQLRREQWPSIRRPGSLVDADVWHYEDVAVPLTRASSSVGMPPDEFDQEPITLDEIRPGCTDASARLSDMDTDGVEASLLFPNLFVRFCGQVFLEAKDKMVASACVRAYNDWLFQEWCDESNGRLHPSTLIPLWDVDLAVAEVERNADRGARAVCFSEIPAHLGLPSMYSGYWEPFFAACAASSIVVNMHIGSSSTFHRTSDDAPGAVRTANHYSNSSFSLTDWLFSGAFERHPNLKVAFSEGQAGWVPYLVSRLDQLWGKRGSPPSRLLPKPPSSYLREHVFFCVYDDPAAAQLFNFFDESNLCFETDYPHADGSWPNTRLAAHKQTATLSPVQRLKVLRMNAADLYGMDRIKCSAVSATDLTLSPNQ